MDVLRAQATKQSNTGGRVSLDLYNTGQTLPRLCGAPHGKAEVSTSPELGRQAKEINAVSVSGIPLFWPTEFFTTRSFPVYIKSIH